LKSREIKKVADYAKESGGIRRCLLYAVQDVDTDNNVEGGESSETKAVKVALEHALAHGADATLFVLAGLHGATTLAGHGLPDRRDILLSYALKTKPHRGGRSTSRKIGRSRRWGLVER